MGPLKTVGVILVVLLFTLAGHASFGMPGLVIGLSISLVVAIGLVKLLRAPAGESRAFEPVPRREAMISGSRRSDHRTTDAA